MKSENLYSDTDNVGISKNSIKDKELHSLSMNQGDKVQIYNKWAKHL